MSATFVLVLGFATGGVLSISGIAWNTAHAVRHRVGLGSAMRMFLVGLGILMATPGAAMLAVPDGPAVIKVVGVAVLVTGLVPVAVATRLRVQS